MVVKKHSPVGKGYFAWATIYTAVWCSILGTQAWEGKEGERGGGWKVDGFCLAGAAWGDGGTWRKGELWSRYRQLEQDSVTS